MSSSRLFASFSRIVDIACQFLQRIQSVHPGLLELAIAIDPRACQKIMSELKLKRKVHFCIQERNEWERNQQRIEKS